MKIKVWFYNKIAEEAKRYNTYINYESENELGLFGLKNDDYIDVSGHLIKESEKAIYIELYTGSFGGSEKNWKTWIPKSVIAD